jgi:hypothetical protein
MPDAPRGLRVPGGATVPIVACAVALWLLTGMTREQAIAGGVALAVGALLALVATR